MDFWDDADNALRLLDDSDHGSAGYTQPYANQADIIDELSSHSSNSGSPFTDYRTFGPNSDMIVLTSDYVSFHLHFDILLAATSNHFNYMLIGFESENRADFDQSPIFAVSETSTVFTMVVCAIYHLPFAEYGPTFNTLSQAVDAMKIYGVAVNDVIAPSTPLYNTLLTHARRHALELYALAAHHDIYDLAVAASTHLLNYQLSLLSDEMATRIGAIYLKRLFFMHLGRAEALRRLLLPPPYPHEPTEACDRATQTSVTRAWALAASSLAWDPRGGTLDLFINLTN
ncbi:hypothetical protein HWV62_22982 [Athelia sp. TMB]|nr:hypothetical protein HWV62_22982 [Athelia sp. TMB]